MISEAVNQTVGYKRKFTLLELYRALTDVPRAATTLIRNNKNPVVDKRFLKRLVLAVTEVNGCAICSYQHTKMALRQGMSNEEISSFLSGEDTFIIPEEAKAIMFAQHFAESRGTPKQYAYEAIVKEYGAARTAVILSALQVILAGNIYGIAYSSFQSRRQGKAYEGSSLSYELSMLLGGVACMPVALTHGVIKGLVTPTAIRLDNRSIP